MNVSKVVYGETTIMDLTDTTAVASDVAQGKVFYLANGDRATGTSSGGGGDANVEHVTVNLSANTDTLEIPNPRPGVVPICWVACVQQTSNWLAYEMLVSMTYRNQDAGGLSTISGQVYTTYQARISTFTGTNFGVAGDYFPETDIIRFGARGGNYVWKTGNPIKIIIVYP